MRTLNRCKGKVGERAGVCKPLKEKGPGGVAAGAMGKERRRRGAANLRGRRQGTL